MGKRKIENWDLALTKIQNVVNQLQPEEFLSSNEAVSDKALTLLKSLYDFTKSPRTPASEKSCNFLNLATSSDSSKSKKKRKLAISKVEYALEELIVDDFDEDQIWEEIQLQNNVLHDSLVTSISKILAHQNRKPVEEVQEEPEDDFQDGLDSDSSEADSKTKVKTKRKQKRLKSYPKSVVDDKFFNLAQMTEFLEKVESKMNIENNSDLNPLRRQGDEDSESEEDDIDLFEDIDEDADEEESNVYYNELFDPPLDEVNEDLKDEDVKSKSVTFNLEEDEDMDDDSGDDEINDLNNLGKMKESQSKEDKDDKPEEILSNFEKRRKKIDENIDIIEEEALLPKPWHLQGEATAANRPENSLLEEHLIYEHLVRQAPEVTVETTKKLEDIIKQRIKDQAWDDVERKIKPIENPSEYKKRLVLDAEKSKMSLTQIYEQEFIQQKKKEDGVIEEDQEPEEFVLIKNDMDKIFAQLDTLSNFHFTPSKPTLEIKFINDAPAITVEEVTPVNVSDATLLAPQEICPQLQGDLKGKAERTSTDKKHDRRIKKKKQKLKRIAQEEKSKLKGLGLRNVKLADNIVKSNLKSKTNDDKGRINQKELKSSKAFFAKLQQQALNQVKEISKKIKKPSDKSQVSAKKFKL